MTNNQISDDVLRKIKRCMDLFVATGHTQQALIGDMA